MILPAKPEESGDSPLATPASASRKSSGLLPLIRYPLAPAVIASKRYASFSEMVIMTIANNG